jgi:hypothetical protein
MVPVISALCAFVVSLFQSRWTMQLAMLALQHQVAVYKHTVHRPRYHPTARLCWPWLSQRGPAWQSALAFVQPRTVIAWQRKQFRDHWYERVAA